MYTDGPTEWRPADLRLAADCPASAGGRRTRGPDAALQRWKALHDALLAWMAQGRPGDTTEIEEAHFADLDGLQREVVTLAFARLRLAVGDADLSPDLPAARVVSEDGSVVLRVPFQFLLTHPGGDQEVLRLRASNPSSTDEAAVVVLGTDPGVHPGDLLADPGQVEAIELDPDEARTRVDDLLRIAGAERSGPPVAGFHCWRCDRPAVCGAYPNPWEGTVPSSARTIKVSRSTLAHLATCRRRVAWKAVFQIPKVEPDLFDEPSPWRGRGSAFHQALEVALVDDDPTTVIRAHADLLPPSERDDLLSLWNAHASLVEGEPHPVTVRVTEHPFGVTIPVGHLGTAVVAIGTIDAAGREADGTPAVVEHRTGAARAIPHLEAELYAVATWRATGVDRVAVHHHHLRAEPGMACTRRVFEAVDLEAALASLRDAAVAIAEWDPYDALSVPHSLGPWCTTCEFAPTCVRWRD